MLRRLAEFRPLVRGLQVRRKWLTKNTFMAKQFNLNEVHYGKPNRFKVQEEYVQYTMKLEDPLVLLFTSQFCNSSLFYATEVSIYTGVWYLYRG